MQFSFRATVATIATSKRAPSTLVFKAITISTLTVLWIAAAAAQQVLPTPSTLAAKRIERAPNDTAIAREPMIPVATVHNAARSGFRGAPTPSGKSGLVVTGIVRPLGH
jgi:hypothetical protein